ncbi:MAG: hypothetical protein KGI38_02690 [Thaumarchaeota archaeon]|nr:hypothetical protein [Nitrososphaerota archaeon]
MTIAIALVVILVVGTVAYSAYEDYSAVRPEFQSGSNQVKASAAPYGSNGETVSINVTVPNSGIYTLNVTLTCNDTDPNVVCTAGHVSVPAGQQQVLMFKLTIVNVQQYLASSNRRINGTVSMGLGPFVSLSIGTDLSSLLPAGGP